MEGLESALFQQRKPTSGAPLPDLLPRSGGREIGFKAPMLGHKLSARRAAGETLTAIARSYNVSHSTISGL